MAKLLENTYRAVNIALVNEMALLCHEMDIDLWEVIERRVDQAVRLPGRSTRPRPGRPLHPDRPLLPHVEGARVRLHTKFIELAADIEPAHGRLRAHPVGALLNQPRQGAQRRRVLCYGASFKPKVSDMR